MMDPSGGGIGKAASEMLKEMQEAQKQVQDKQLDPSQKADSQNFADTMKTQQTGEIQNLKRVNETQKAGNILQTAKINANMPSTRVGRASKLKNSKLFKMLKGLVTGQDRMNNIMKMALSGRQFSPPELLGLQAGVYRFSQELELTSKVVEKATSGIKQTMNTQV